MYACSKHSCMMHASCMSVLICACKSLNDLFAYAWWCAYLQACKITCCMLSYMLADMDSTSSCMQVHMHASCMKACMHTCMHGGMHECMHDSCVDANTNAEFCYLVKGIEDAHNRAVANELASQRWGLQGSVSLQELRFFIPAITCKKIYEKSKIEKSKNDSCWWFYLMNWGRHTHLCRI